MLELHIQLDGSIDNESSIDLSLSCSFSDAESSASDPDGSLESASDAVVEPYMYEPLASDHDSTAVDDDISAVEDECRRQWMSSRHELVKIWNYYYNFG